MATSLAAPGLAPYLYSIGNNEGQGAMRQVWQTSMLTLAAVFAATTAQSETITHEFHYPSYDPQYVQYAASKGSFPVVLVDSPIAGDELVGSLALPGSYPQVPLTEVSEAERKGQYLVLAFHSPINIGGDKLCVDPSTAASNAPGGALRVQAAFCSGDEVLSEAVMTTERPSGTADKGFNGAMARLLNRVLSTRSPNDDGSCGRSSC